MDRGAWQATVHEIEKSWTQLSHTHTHTHTHTRTHTQKISPGSGGGGGGIGLLDSSLLELPIQQV